MRTRHIYLAGPLFTHADRAYLAALRDRLRQLTGVTVTWPGDLFDDAHLTTLGAAAKTHIFEGCRDAIHDATQVVALLDGTQVDDGTAWEIGYAYARGLPVWGLRTDFRQAGDTAHSVANAMIECSCARIVRSADELLAALVPVKKKNSSMQDLPYPGSSLTWGPADPWEDYLEEVLQVQLPKGTTEVTEELYFQALQDKLVWMVKSAPDPQEMLLALLKALGDKLVPWTPSLRYLQYLPSPEMREFVANLITDRGDWEQFPGKPKDSPKHLQWLKDNQDDLTGWTDMKLMTEM